MLSIYKKVFLASQPRFSFLGITSAMLGSSLLGVGSSFVGSAGKGLLGGLFGGGGDKGNDAADIIRAQQEEQERKDDLAGGVDKSTVQAPTAIPTMADRLGSQVGQLGKQFAGDFIEKLGSKFIDSKITSMFAPKQISPMERGIQDRAYTQARFGGRINPWEVLGSSAGAGGQGGRGAASIQQKTARETAATGARSQERAAGITTAPKIEEVNIKYQKLHPEIRALEQGTARTGAETEKLNITNSLQRNLTSYEARLKQAQGDVAFQQKNNLVKEGELIKARLNNEIARLPETKAKAKIQSVLSEYAEALAAGKIGAPLLGILGTIMTLLGLRGLAKGKKGFGRKGVTSSPHPKGKIQNWPRYGPKAGQTFR